MTDNYEYLTVEDFKQEVAAGGDGLLPLEFMYDYADWKDKWFTVVEINSHGRTKVVGNPLLPNGISDSSFHADHHCRWRRVANFLPMRREDINPDKVA